MKETIVRILFYEDHFRTWVLDHIWFLLHKKTCVRLTNVSYIPIHTQTYCSRQSKIISFFQPVHKTKSQTKVLLVSLIGRLQYLKGVVSYFLTVSNISDESERQNLLISDFSSQWKFSLPVALTSECHSWPDFLSPVAAGATFGQCPFRVWCKGLKGVNTFFASTPFWPTSFSHVPFLIQPLTHRRLGHYTLQSPCFFPDTPILSLLVSLHLKCSNSRRIPFFRCRSGMYHYYDAWPFSITHFWLIQLTYVLCLVTLTKHFSIKKKRFLRVIMKERFWRKIVTRNLKEGRK